MANALLNAGRLPANEADETAPLNRYLRRLLLCVYDPEQDKCQRYTPPMFTPHAANLAPVWNRSECTGHPGSPFTHGGGLTTFAPINRPDWQINAQLLLFDPTDSGKSAH